MPKKRTYEVLVTAYKTYVVAACSKNEAFDLVAEDACFLTKGWEYDTMRIENTLRSEDQVKTAIRHGAEDIRD